MTHRERNPLLNDKRQRADNGQVTSSLLDRPRLEAVVSQRRITAEGVAAFGLAWAMWRLAATDGGVDVRDAVRALAPLGVAIPAAAIGVSTLSRRAGIALAAVAGGIVLSVATASYRADMVAPLLTYSAMAVSGLAAVAIWRRPWGSAAIALVVLGAGARAWWAGLEVWYGSSLNESAIDRWMSLPWHNQSGALMAAVAVAFGVAAATADRWVISLGAAASLAGAAVVLSDSRGSIIALFIGVAVAIVARPRRWWRWALMGGAGAAVLVSLSYLPGAVATDSGESLPAIESSSARLAHWRAAAGMFADSPLTGQGVGSYRLASSQWAEGGVNPTSHAHNEYVEFFAEGGLMLGIPATLLLAGVAMATARVLSRREDDLRGRVALGAAAVWVTLAVHAGADFDWLFPILAMAFAVAAGVVVAAAGPRRGVRWPVVPIALLFVVGLGAGFVEGFGASADRVHPPWNVGAASAVAERAVAAGDYDRADSVIASARAWNPGDAELVMLEAAVGLSTGTKTAADVVVAAEKAVPGFGVRLEAAGQLSGTGHLAEASTLVAGVIEDFDDYEGWNLAGAAAVAYRIEVDLAGRLGGCTAAEHAAGIAMSTRLATAFGSEDYAAQAAAFCG